MLSRRIFLASILVAALLATGCLKDVVRDATKSVGEMMNVRNALLKKFGDEVNVNVNHNGRHSVMTVTFINSPLNDKTRAERSARARQAAVIVSANYARNANLDVVWIGFARVTTKLFVFHESHMFDFFQFDGNGLEINPDRSDTEYPATRVPLDTTVGYLSNTDETDISANNIQLEGQPGGLGITVLPHFKVQGDAREQLVRPPQEVEFNIASYSEKPRFVTKTTSISFLAGGRVVFHADAEFNGNDAQFCYLKVPYPAFKKMVSASDLIIKLGDKEYPLTPSQFSSIQKMNSYLIQ